MDRDKAQKALADFDMIYKNKSTGEYYIDTDEAQVALDLATSLREALS